MKLADYSEKDRWNIEQNKEKIKENIKVISVARFTLFVVICTLVCMFLLFFAAFSVTGALNTVYSDFDYTTVKVADGDTLWTIAGEFYEDEDLRQAVYSIAKVNGISNGIIYPGDVLRLPYRL